MDRSGLQRIIPIILVLIVIGLAAFALFSLGRTLFSGGTGQSPSPSPESNTAQQTLTTVTAERGVRMSVRGPIRAGENFHSYAITVTPDARNMTTYVGYVGQEVEKSDLANDAQAYTQLVTALNRAKLMEGTALTGDANNTDGICATGTLYVFETLHNDKPVQTLWTTTCKGSAGSLKANLAQVRNLFQLQIPTFSKLSDKVNM